MKLFSRKAIVAGATALAVTFAGTSVAVAQDENTTGNVTNTEAPAEETPAEETPENDAPEEDNSSDDDANDDDASVPSDKEEEEEEGMSSDPKDITAWISVFTAVIGALGTLFTFATKHFDFMA